jgi:hypothetical protein
VSGAVSFLALRPGSSYAWAIVSGRSQQGSRSRTTATAGEEMIVTRWVVIHGPNDAMCWLRARLSEKRQEKPRKTWGS